MLILSFGLCVPLFDSLHFGAAPSHETKYKTDEDVLDTHHTILKENSPSSCAVVLTHLLRDAGGLSRESPVASLGELLRDDRRLPPRLAPRCFRLPLWPLSSAVAAAVAAAAAAEEEEEEEESSSREMLWRSSFRSSSDSGTWLDAGDPDRPRPPRFLAVLPLLLLSPSPFTALVSARFMPVTKLGDLA
jgi:hypothetical protein